NSIDLEKPSLAVAFEVPLKKFHELTLSSHAARLNFAQVPDSRNDNPPLVSGGSARPATEPRTSGPPPFLLAQFLFDGDARDITGQGHDFSLKNTEFRDGALFLNGIYTYNGRGDGYTAVCRTPELDYDGFAVALRFKSLATDGARCTLLVG